LQLGGADIAAHAGMAVQVERRFLFIINNGDVPRVVVNLPACHAVPVHLIAALFAGVRSLLGGVRIFDFVLFSSTSRPLTFAASLSVSNSTTVSPLRSTS
jgi:hypothetical protein